MTNPLDPAPRDNRDLILETIAFTESVQALVWAVAAQLDLKKLLDDYDGASAVLMARVQGENHPDRYLDLLEQHIQKRRAGLLGLIATS